MNASPVGTEPAGLVCVCDQQQRGFASTEIELLDLIRTAFAPKRALVQRVPAGTLVRGRRNPPADQNGVYSAAPASSRRQ